MTNAEKTCLENVQQKVNANQVSLESCLRRIEQMQKDLMACKAGRCIIFIDNTNLTQSIKRLSQQASGLGQPVQCFYKLDYFRLVDFLADGRPIQQVRFYYSDFPEEDVPNDMRSGYESRQSFWRFLHYKGFSMFRSNLTTNQQGIVREKGLDAAIVRDMQRLLTSRGADTFILVSGDADYVQMATDARSEYGVRLEVAFFETFTASKLKYNANSFTDLTMCLEELRRTDTRPEYRQETMAELAS